MTYKLLNKEKDYDKRLKKLMKIERKYGGEIISIEQGDTFTLITVENRPKNWRKEEAKHEKRNVPKVQIPVDAPDRQPEVLPVVQAIPEKRSAEKGKPEKIKSLNMTLRDPGIFAAILSGKKRIISTHHNPRKDRYFTATVPKFANIRNNGGMIRLAIERIADTPHEWQVHLGNIIETSGVPCKHPPNRLYAWSGEDARGPFTCVVCCRCGDVLKGNAADFEKHEESYEPF
jgi:hypothetical protein